MDHASWGPEYSSDYVSTSLAIKKKRIAAAGWVTAWATSERALCVKTAAAIADGLVIGWFQGRMEWGPRALGNRSILADPRRVEMRDILNSKIKRREMFRPFAPSILEEAAG